MNPVFPLDSRPWLLAETSWTTVQATRYQVAVLPWGATEAHNYHLPYATDNLQNDAIAEAAGRLAWEAGARVTVLPNVPFGVQTGQRAIPLCLNLNPSTQLLILRDLIDSVAQAGIERFVLLNGHGGNDFRQMLRQLQVEFPGVFLSSVSWFQALPRTGWFERRGDHADEGETSLIMHLHPHLVNMDAAGDGAQRPWKLAALREGWAWAQRDWPSLTADTGAGDPALSSTEKGERFFQALTARLAGYLVELAAADIHDLYE